jgi:catechol 2,3-dioxygenase-like lactoylglutathione lyase family enzyme
VKLGVPLLFVEDFETMLAFYGDVLGLEVTDEDPAPSGRMGRRRDFVDPGQRARVFEVA